MVLFILASSALLVCSMRLYLRQSYFNNDNHYHLLTYPAILISVKGMIYIVQEILFWDLSFMPHSYQFSAL